MNGHVDNYGRLVANDSGYPLLGVGLLVGHDLRISYRSGNVTIE